MLRIIYSCEDYAVAVKPYGMLSEFDAARPNMITSLAEELHLPQEKVYPVHRLDATTEGLMVYALTKNGAAELSKCISEGMMQKSYTALITAADGLPENGEMRDHLFFDRRAAKSFVVSPDKKGAKEAILFYSLAEKYDFRGNTVTQAKIVLCTGRTHQIRAQFGARHSPIIGDGKYGSRVNYKKPALFSSGIEFTFRGERVKYILDEEIKPVL